jgi:hypothetical protein
MYLTITTTQNPATDLGYLYASVPAKPCAPRIDNMTAK